MPDNAKITNLEFVDRVTSDDRDLVKQAQDTVNEYTRTKAREDGFLRKVLPPITLTNDEIDRDVDTDKPTKIVDKEPDSPAAYQIPFATTPNGHYIRGKRYRVNLNRFVTPEFTKDVDELRTYHMDIRQVISDNAIKDVLAEEDRKFIHACNAVMGGAVNATAAATGEVHWHDFADPITRDSLTEASKIMPRLPSRLSASTALINMVSIRDVLKWGRDEAGGDLSQDLLLKGFAGYQMLGMNWIVTIKRALVPDDTVFFFAEPQFLGKHYSLYDITMFMETRAQMITFFAYETVGAAIGNVAGVARADFNASGSSD